MPGNVQLIKALQPLVQAAETTLQLDEAKRARTIIRVDAGAGTQDDLNWLLARGYEIMAKEYSGRRVVRLAKTVTKWVQDPDWPERSCGLGQRTTCWVCSPSPADCRTLLPTRWHLRGMRILICSLSIEQVLVMLQRSNSLVTDPVAALGAYVNYYDLRGGDIETTFKGDKQGLGLTKRSKKRFEAQHMLVLLGSLAHNVVVWVRQWLSCSMIQHYGLLRMVRDVLHVSGLLRFDGSGSIVEIVLNQESCLAHSFYRPLQVLLAPLQVVVNLGEI